MQKASENEPRIRKKGRKPGRPPKKSGNKKKSTKEVIRDLRDIPEPKATVAATEEQYEEIVRILWDGTGIIRANKQVAIAIQTEACTGLRIGDVMALRLNDIIRDGYRYRFNMRESKTGKLRTFTVPDPVYNMLAKHAKVNGISPEEPLFSIGIRDVQRKLSQVCDYLSYTHISTHSFRKRFATAAYRASGGDLEICRRLLQHSSQAVTLRYIGIDNERVEKTLRKITKIIASY